MLPSLHRVNNNPPSIKKHNDWSMALTQMYMSVEPNPIGAFGPLEYAFLTSEEHNQTPIQQLSTSWNRMNVQNKAAALSIVLNGLDDPYLRAWGAIGSNVMGMQVYSFDERDLNTEISEGEYYHMLGDLAPYDAKTAAWRKGAWEGFNGLTHHLRSLRQLDVAHGKGNKPHRIVVVANPNPKGDKDTVTPNGWASSKKKAPTKK